MQDEDKFMSKEISHRSDSEFESSDAASTVKQQQQQWDNRWTPSEVYDSSGTTSTASEQGDEYNDVDYHRQHHRQASSRCNNNDGVSLSELHSQMHGFCKSQPCLCQFCLLGYARIIALQGSLPNVAAAANCAASMNAPFYNNHCPSNPSLLAPKEIAYAGAACPSAHYSCSCCSLPQAAHMQPPPHHLQKPYNSHSLMASFEEGSRRVANSSQQPNHHHRQTGSIDRRKRRLRNKIDRDHRAKSQSDLVYYEQQQHQQQQLQQQQQQRNKPLYCSLQQLHIAACNAQQQQQQQHSVLSTEERLRKLENERSALHMEVSILSEQVETQSNKIVELENSLQEKKDSLRQLEESLQKEVLLRSALETQKLELLSSLSEMKLRQASLEHENLGLRTASPLTNGERFSRHAGHYSSLPRPPTSAKKGVAFANEKTIIKDTTNYIKPPPPKSFNELSISEVSEWLSNLGLESYTNELKRWGATGNKLLDSSNHQLEKELDIKNVLHRKKLLYAIESERCKGAGFFGSEKMDNAAVLRWLDDIGLPQHKEAFHNAKVDGRVLNRLTTEDLLILNVTAQLHAASLRRGIQVLRELNFEYDHLERRAASENGHAHCDGTNDEFNSQVTLWTNHRVMEWLRVVDLAEYAPNLRGSGVHGGLMVYEHRFTSELLATILSIPPAKTLLRRHLTTHFNQIVGREVVQQKREIENTLGFIPLTLTARLKVPKKANFTLKRKKSKNEVDFGNLVCPMEPSPPGTPSSSTTASTSPASPNLNSPSL